MKGIPANILIRAIGEGDAADLAALEARCVGAARWGEAGYRDFGVTGLIGWVAEAGGVVVGFVLIRVVADELEILNLAVDVAVRRQGLGRNLLRRAIEEARKQGVASAHLEVRESNAAARAIYASLGFTERARRKNYYSQPVEDAILLALRLH